MTEPHSFTGLVIHEGDSRKTRSVPLTAISIESQVTGPLAEVTVTQTYANREDRPVEAMFTFPLPSRAAVRHFVATIGDRRVVGEIASRDEAFEKYDDAIADGHGAFLLDQERPNLFTTSVGNLEPKRDVTIELTYVTELPRDGRELRLQIPTTIGPKYTPVEPYPDHEDIDRVSPPMTPLDPGYTCDLRVCADLLAPIASIESPTHRVVNEFDGTRAVIRLAENDRTFDRDFVLLLRTQEQVETQPQIESNEQGEQTLLVNFRPELPSERKPVELLFLVDCSGSMQGPSIVEARRTLLKALDQLGPEDRFGIIRFGSHCEPLIGLDWRTRMERHGHSSEADQKHVYQTFPVDDESLAQVRSRIETMNADLGGTEVLKPLEIVLSAPPTEGLDRRVVLITDGQVSNEEGVISTTRDLIGDARVFTFGVGPGASEHLVRGVAEAGRGSAELVVSGEQIDRIVLRHFARITQGCFDDGRLQFEGIEVEDVTPSAVPPLAPGEEFFALAKIRSGSSGRASLRGSVNGTPVECSVAIECSESDAAASEHGLLAVSWARRHIAELELEAAKAPYGSVRRGSSRTDRTRGIAKKKILEIALAHSLVSSETSFVAVEERAEKEKTVERAVLRRVPLPMMRGQTRGLLAGGFNGPEPTISAGVYCRSFDSAPLAMSMDVDADPVADVLLKVFDVAKHSRGRDAKAALTELMPLRNRHGRWSWSDELAEALGVEPSERDAFFQKIDESPFSNELVLALLIAPFLWGKPELLDLARWLDGEIDASFAEALGELVLELGQSTLMSASP